VPARVPGGSSSGAAVAVAANFVDFALGELLHCHYPLFDVQFATSLPLIDDIYKLVILFSFPTSAYGNVYPTVLLGQLFQLFCNQEIPSFFCCIFNFVRKNN